MKLQRVIRVTALHCSNLDARSEVVRESHAPANVPPVGHRANLNGFWRIKKFLAPTGDRNSDRVTLPATAYTFWSGSMIRDLKYSVVYFKYTIFIASRSFSVLCNNMDLRCVLEGCPYLPFLFTVQNPLHREYYVGYSENKHRLRIYLAHPRDCYFAHVQWLPLSNEKPQTSFREIRVMFMFVPVR